MWFTILTLIGAVLLSICVIAHREGLDRLVWPLWVVVAALSLGIGLTWPNGAT